MLAFPSLLLEVSPGGMMKLKNLGGVVVPLGWATESAAVNSASNVARWYFAILESVTRT
jgi:hypothetical protein